MIYRLFIPIFFLAFVGHTAFAQDDTFNEAKIHLANHKLNKSIPILEKLWASDPKNANLNYLLGLCYVKEDANIEKSVELLETASQIYATDYSAGSNKERRAPEYVYYYLTIAYSKNGQCEDALRSLNKFYQVYSYSDEYYLVDGQKWVRECNVKKKEEEPKVEVPPVAEVPSEETTSTEDQVATTEEINSNESTESVIEEAPTKEQEEEARKAIVAEVMQEKQPQIKERLIPFDDWDNLRTREVSFTSLNSQYGIQIASLINPKPTREFENVKNVEVYVDENGIFRYVIGRFLYRKQAETLLAKIREQGYADAFIVDINQPYYNKEVLGIGEDNIDWHIDGNVDFRVQIGAFTTIVTGAVAEKYLEVEGIREYQQNGLTILTVGAHNTYEEAANQREQLKEQGIEDAFVVAFNRGNKISLKEAKDYVEKQQTESAPDKADVKPKRADF